jgi:hypothetical protein
MLFPVLGDSKFPEAVGYQTGCQTNTAIVDEIYIWNRDPAELYIVEKIDDSKQTIIKDETRIHKYKHIFRCSMLHAPQIKADTPYV